MHWFVFNWFSRAFGGDKMTWRWRIQVSGCWLLMILVSSRNVSSFFWMLLRFLLLATNTDRCLLHKGSLLCTAGSLIYIIVVISTIVCFVFLPIPSVLVFECFPILVVEKVCCYTAHTVSDGCLFLVILLSVFESLAGMNRGQVKSTRMTIVFVVVWVASLQLFSIC